MKNDDYDDDDGARDANDDISQRNDLQSNRDDSNY